MSHTHTLPLFILRGGNKGKGQEKLVCVLFELNSIENVCIIQRTVILSIGDQGFAEQKNHLSQFCDKYLETLNFCFPQSNSVTQVFLRGPIYIFLSRLCSEHRFTRRPESQTVKYNFMHPRHATREQGNIPCSDVVAKIDGTVQIILPLLRAEWFPLLPIS